MYYWISYLALEATYEAFHEALVSGKRPVGMKYGERIVALEKLVFPQ